MIYALLTGKGNNSFPNKNLRNVLGKPLLYYPAIAAKNCEQIQGYFVSSENDDILSAAGELGYEKIKRPAFLSNPEARHEEVILHGIEDLRSRGFNPEILVVLLANSGTVLSSWIGSCIEILKKDPRLSAVVPVKEDQERHPFRAKTLDNEGNLKGYFEFQNNEISSNRQELPRNFFLCHNFWVLRLSNSVFGERGEDPWGFMGKRVKPYLVEDGFDVHNEIDLIKTENWLRKNWKV